MNNGDTSADAIQRQMREIRREIKNDVKDVVSSANQLLDWKSYMRNSPWLVLGGAAALGYLMIPRRSRELDAARETRQSLDSLADEVRSQANPPPASTFSRLVMPVITGIVLRVGTAYGARLAGQILDTFQPTPESKTETGSNDGPMKMREASHP